MTSGVRVSVPARMSDKVNDVKQQLCERELQKSEHPSHLSPAFLSQCLPWRHPGRRRTAVRLIHGDVILAGQKTLLDCNIAQCATLSVGK